MAIKKIENKNTGKNMRKKKPVCTPGGNVN
jgi:hypothetical protein